MLTVIGTGIRRPQQLTMEGVAAIQAARRVLHLTGTGAQIAVLLKELGIHDARSLDDLYRPGVLDDANYEAISNEIVLEVDAHGDVALLLYGHPRLGVTLTAILEARLPEVHTVPAVSSFDTMMNDLKRDPLERGTTLLDANRLLLFEFRLEPCLDHFIYHVDAVATRLTTGELDNGSHGMLVRDYLLRFYPPSHRVTVLASSSGDCDEPVRQEVELGKLAEYSSLMTTGASLFVPGLKPRTVNREIYARLTATPSVANVRTEPRASPKVPG